MDVRNEKAFLSLKTIRALDKTNYTIPLLKPRELSLLERIIKNAASISSIGHCYTGEIDLTQDKHYLSGDKTKAVLIKGAILDRYLIKTSMSQGEILFLKSRDYLEENHGARSQHHKLRRIVMQGITGVNERVRLKMTLATEGTFCANSVNYLVLHNASIQPEFLLAVLNSTLLNFIFSKTSTNSNVNGYEVDNLPIVLAKEKDQEQLGKLASTILAAKQRNAKADTSALERKIDSLVYTLYGLTPDDIKLIENGFLK